MKEKRCQLVASWCLVFFGALLIFTPYPLLMVLVILLNLGFGCRWYNAMTSYMTFVNLLNFASIKSRNSSTLIYYYVVTSIFYVNH